MLFEKKKQLEVKNFFYSYDHLLLFEPSNFKYVFKKPEMVKMK